MPRVGAFGERYGCIFSVKRGGFRAKWIMAMEASGTAQCVSAAFPDGDMAVIYVLKIFDFQPISVRWGPACCSLNPPVPRWKKKGPAWETCAGPIERREGKTCAATADQCCREYFARRRGLFQTSRVSGDPRLLHKNLRSTAEAIAQAHLDNVGLLIEFQRMVESQISPGKTCSSCQSPCNCIPAWHSSSATPRIRCRNRAHIQTGCSSRSLGN